MLEKYILAINTIGNSGNNSIDTIFKLCVFILVDIADFFGISYEAANIIIFVIIQPSLIIVLFVLWQIEKIRNHKKKYNL
jgi:hypothetical protein